MHNRFVAIDDVSEKKTNRKLFNLYLLLRTEDQKTIN